MLDEKTIWQLLKEVLALLFLLGSGRLVMDFTKHWAFASQANAKTFFFLLVIFMLVGAVVLELILSTYATVLAPLVLLIFAEIVSVSRARRPREP